MEVAEVRRRVRETIERARRQVADRRVRVDTAGQAYDRLLSQTAVPLFRQIANVLRAEGHAFTVFTPAGSVRLMSDRHGEDFVELLLNTVEEPRVVLHTSHGRARRIDESERVLGDPAAVAEEDVLAGVLAELEAFVER
jgi:hypothetical protein